MEEESDKPDWVKDAEDEYGDTRRKLKDKPLDEVLKEGPTNRDLEVPDEYKHIDTQITFRYDSIELYKLVNKECLANIKYVKPLMIKHGYVMIQDYLSDLVKSNEFVGEVLALFARKKENKDIVKSMTSVPELSVSEGNIMKTKRSTFRPFWWVYFGIENLSNRSELSISSIVRLCVKASLSTKYETLCYDVDDFINQCKYIRQLNLLCIDDTSIRASDRIDDNMKDEILHILNKYKRKDSEIYNMFIDRFYV